MSWLRRVFGSGSTRRLARYEHRLRPIERQEASLRSLSDEGLRLRSDALKTRAREGEALDRLLVPAFALVREASRRTLGLRHYDVQLLGGMALHDGCVAEMKTGEGKTLVATLPAYLHALTGRGVHIVTVNDYLARRDSEWMGPVFRLLGLRVGLILETMGDDETEDLDARKAAYACDVTYATNHELCFDFLRDNLAVHPEEVVHRDFHFALVDEVDFLLIDEARTPLIISGPSGEDQGLYERVDRVVRRLTPGLHLYVDDKSRTGVLSDQGLLAVEQALGVASLADPEQLALYHTVCQSVLAHGLYRRDVDYIVRHGRVFIVDEFTGRVSEDKRFADGLHQALEAKEGVTVRPEDRTLAKVTYQTFFGRYPHLCGMTGTAWSAREELRETYGRDVVRVPTHRRMIREDFEDLVFATRDAKHAAMVAEIQELRGAGRPVLVGTTSVAESERLSHLLDEQGIPHEVLNAKNHEAEAALIAQAGRSRAVTISTNMAGRGVDIVLGGAQNPGARTDRVREGDAPDPATDDRQDDEHRTVVEAGGLFVIGTGHHESPRIDSQLRGRAGRQGDPGSSQFFISLDDDLYKKFGKEEIRDIRKKLSVSNVDHSLDEPLEVPGLIKRLNSLQKKVEEENHAIRREVLKYDLVVHGQRETIYAWRRTLVTGEGFDPEGLVSELCAELCGRHEAPADAEAALAAHFHTAFDFNGVRPVDVEQTAVRIALSRMHEHEQRLGAAAFHERGRRLLLASVDELWTQHLTHLEQVEEGIGLQGYAQVDPVVIWRRDASLMFEELLFQVRSRAISLWFLVETGAARTRPTHKAERRIRRKR